jgi:multidrug resistance efflux pump
MDLLLILTYTAICVVIFKVFKIPLTKWTVPSAILGGIVLIGTLIFAMNYNHPYSEISRDYFIAVPIVPPVTGQVVEVNATPNQVMEKDDILLKLDPAPFEAKVASIRAQLKSAQDDLARAKRLIGSGSISKRQLDLAQESVDNLTPQLASAEWELSNTIVRAPSRGYVTQMAVRPGVMAASLPLRPVMTFIPFENRRLVGWFRQNSMLRLQVGYEAEIAFDGIPGEVFSGIVTVVFPALAEGQVQASGTLLGMDTPLRAGRIPVQIEIDDPDFEQYKDHIPGGAYGQAAIYSDHFHHVAIMRKILLRMAAWLNYIFPFH